MTRTMRASSVLLLGTLVFSSPLLARDETSRPTAGFNLFSVEQDVEIGRQSAAQADRQLPLLRDRNADRYLNKIISKLAAKAPGARYPYAIKAVNAAGLEGCVDDRAGAGFYNGRQLFDAGRNTGRLAYRQACARRGSYLCGERRRFHDSRR